MHGAGSPSSYLFTSSPSSCSSIKRVEIKSTKPNKCPIWFFSIHPRYKHDVGYRLSRSGLAIAYGQQVEFQGPIVQNVTYFNGSSTVNITYTAVSSIELRNPNGFEVYHFFSLPFK